MEYIRGINEPKHIGSNSGAHKSDESTDAFEKILANQEKRIGDEIPEAPNKHQLNDAEIQKAWEIIRPAVEQAVNSSPSPPIV